MTDTPDKCPACGYDGCDGPLDTWWDTGDISVGPTCNQCGVHPWEHRAREAERELAEETLALQQARAEVERLRAIVLKLLFYSGQHLEDAYHPEICRGLLSTEDMRLLEDDDEHRDTNNVARAVLEGKP